MICVAAFLDRRRRQYAQTKKNTAMPMMIGAIAAATGMDWLLSDWSEVD